jgi:subtilisin family serine protease
MKRFVIWKLVFAVAAVAFMATGVAARQSSSTRYFVVYKSGRVPANAAARIAAAGGRGQRALHEIGAVSAWGDANFAAIVAADRDVLAVGPQRIHARPSAQFTEHASETAAAPLPADNLYFFQWNLRRIGAPAVWAQFPLPTDGRRPTVAVLDTGVADNHPDLAGQIVSSKATSFCNTPGGPGNTAGYPIYATLIDFDAHDPWEPADGCTAAAPRFEGHGTHVAGTVAARFGGSRVVGVAPDAAIAVYKVFDRYRVTLTPPGEEEEETIDDIGAFDEPVFLTRPGTHGIAS